MRQAVAERAAAAKPLGEHGGEREGAGRMTVSERAAMAKPLEASGKPKGRKGNQANNLSLKPLGKRGPTADYLTARIARDRPDVLDRMTAGEFKSVRAAAIEAGISPMASWRTLASGSRSSTKPPTKRSRFAGRLKVGCASHN